MSADYRLLKATLSSPSPNFADPYDSSKGGGFPKKLWCCVRGSQSKAG